MSARSFQEVLAWQKAHHYVLKVYTYTSKFPKEETYGLKSQFRRAAVSIASNIAEAFRKVSDKEKIRYLNIAQTSFEECKYYEILSDDLAYGEKESLALASEEASKILNAYARAISNRIST